MSNTNSPQHVSASASHYDTEAATYDVFNESRSAETNITIEALLKQNGIENVLDLSCGTGSQVFWLQDKGLNVTGVDINASMLDIAKEKAQEKGLTIEFILGDMRTSRIGKFDAVLTIFNAIGHLTQDDFKVTLQNIAQNLKPGGLYIFDIFNLDYLLHKDNITQLTIDWQKEQGPKKVREIQYSTISPQGILTSYDIYHEQEPNQAPNITTAMQTLQVYSASQLDTLLTKHGFTIQQQTAIDGSPLNPQKSERILTVCSH